MAIEVTVTPKRVFTFQGAEYATLGELKVAMVKAVLLKDGDMTIDPIGDILANSDRLVEILRYSGRKPRTPRPEGWMAPPRKAKRAKKASAVKAEVAA